MTSHHMDRDALEEAMRVFGKMFAGQNTEIVLAAARAHLDTLPRTKMVWVVEGSARAKSPYTRTCETEDRETLNSYVECLQVDGFPVVTIFRREVPA